MRIPDIDAILSDLKFVQETTVMIIALEIGAALSLVAMIAGYVSSLPKPQRVPVRVRNTGPRQR